MLAHRVDRIGLDWIGLDRVCVSGFGFGLIRPMTPFVFVIFAEAINEFNSIYQEPIMVLSLDIDSCTQAAFIDIHVGFDAASPIPNAASCSSSMQVLVIVIDIDIDTDIAIRNEI